MNLRNLFYLLAIQLLFCFPIIAQNNTLALNPAPPLGSESSTSSEDEIEAIAQSINRYLQGAGIRISALDTEVSGTERKVSGKVSLFGFDNLTLSGALSSKLKVKNLSIVFPAAASIDLAKFSKMLGNADLSDFLPAGFPINTGLSIQQLNLDFENNGRTIQQFKADFEVGGYSIPGFDAVALEGMDLSFDIESPTRSARKVGGNITGRGRLGALPVSIAAQLSSNPSDIAFVSTIENINLQTVLTSFVDNAEVNAFLDIVPDIFKEITLNTLQAEVQPATGLFKGVGNSTLGSIEMQLTAPRGNKKAVMCLGIAPPPSFKFSEISGALIALDSLDFSGSAFIMSTGEIASYTSSLSALASQPELRVSKGFNMYSSIAFGEDIADLLKVNQLNLSGWINETFTAISMDAALDLDLQFSEDVKMSEIKFGMRLTPTVPLLFSISGMMEVKMGTDRLGFNAAFEMAPIDQQMRGQFFMQALKRQRGEELFELIDEFGNPVPPEWAEPFGIPGIGLRRLGASAGIDLKLAPVFLNEVGFTAAARLGTVPNTSKHVQADGTIVVNISNPTRSVLEVDIKNMTILALIEAFVEDHGIQDGPIKDFLGSGLEDSHLLVVPVDGLEFFGKRYSKGIAAGATMNFGGYKVYSDFSLSKSGVSGYGSLDPINWGNGQFVLSGRTGDRPEMRLKLMKGQAPEVYVDGIVNLLGISSETTMSIDNTGFELITVGKIFDEFEAVIEAKGKAFTQEGSGLYLRAALRNDLVSRLNQEVTKGIEQATISVQNQLQQNRRDLLQARADLVKIDQRIAVKAAQVASRREADLQAMRNEALRARREQKAALDFHKKNIRTLTRWINEKGDWPWELAEKVVLYNRIAYHQSMIEVAKPIYDSYDQTVNELANIGEDFPIDIELSDLYIEKAAKETYLETALLTVDVVENVSVSTLEAANFIMDNALGGIFDIKSAEFEGNLGFNDNYHIKVNFNVTFAKAPYHFDAYIDFKNPEASIGKIVQDLLTGNLLKQGFKETFSSELEQKKGALALKSAPVGLDKIERTPPNVYMVTVETMPDVDAGSMSTFLVDIYGNNNNRPIKNLALSKDFFTGFQPGTAVTFPLQTYRDIGEVQKIIVRPASGSVDNLKIKGISVASSLNDKKVHAECSNCNVTSSKTLSFDGKSYKDYLLTISTNNTALGGTDSDIFVQLEGTKGRSPRVQVSKMWTGEGMERGTLTKIPLSFEDIGEVKKVYLSGGTAFSPWVFGGVTVTDEAGNVSLNYCNCFMKGETKPLPLRKPGYFEDYYVEIKTSNGLFDGTSTVADVFFSIRGTNGMSNRLSGTSFLQSRPGVFGEQVYQKGVLAKGTFTDRKIGNIQGIKIKNTNIIDNWVVESITIRKGNEVYQYKGRKEVWDEYIPLRRIQ